MSKFVIHIKQYNYLSKRLYNICKRIDWNESIYEDHIEYTNCLNCLKIYLKYITEKLHVKLKVPKNYTKRVVEYLYNLQERIKKLEK